MNIRYHTVSPVLAASGAPPQSLATLINGLGRFSANVTSPLAVISVIPNKRYRFRLVSISCDPNFIFSIDKHTLVGCKRPLSQVSCLNILSRSSSRWTATLSNHLASIPFKFTSVSATRSSSKQTSRRQITGSALCPTSGHQDLEVE